jgi:hypothetical protein
MVCELIRAAVGKAVGEGGMKVELTVAIIAGGFAVASACIAAWSVSRSNANATAIEQLKIESEKLKLAAQRQREISKFSEPLARSAYDLQSRLYNILKQNLVEVYLVKGNDREKSYVADNTVFLVGQYLCWTELVRREIQFIDLGENNKTRELLHLQDTIYSLWGTDAQPPLFRIFAGEQRAIGEALIQTGVRGLECMGYGAFLKTFNDGTNPLIDALRADVLSLNNGLGHAAGRLTNLQHALIDLLKMLDPEYLRFPRSRRDKV